MANKLLSRNKEIFLLVFIGIIWRALLYLLLYNQITIVNDSEGYVFLAKRILDFDLAGYDGERSLGYPALIALAFGNINIVVLYQFILGIITSVFWFKTLLKLNFSNTHSLWITLFIESFLNVFFYETTILTESFSLFFVSVLIYLLSGDYFEKSNLKDEILMGFVLGCLVLIKPFYAFIPFLIYGFAMIKDFSIRNIVTKKLIIFIFPLTAYFGWSYVNKINTGHFVATTFFGLNMAQNCVCFAENCPEKYNWIGVPYAKYREIAINDNNKDVAMAIWDAYESGAYDFKHLEFVDFSAELGDYARETILQNPFAYMKQVVFRSWLEFWRTSIFYEDGKFKSDEALTLFENVWLLQRRLFNVFKFGFLLLIPFAFIRFIKDRKITLELVMITLVFATSILQGLATYGTNSKNSFPFEFIMILSVLLFVKKNIVGRINMK